MKKVSFSNIVNVKKTYSKYEYDRKQIDSILYKKLYNRITVSEWMNILIKLDLYKLYEMDVHPTSLKNNSYKSNLLNF